MRKAVVVMVILIALLVISVVEGVQLSNLKTQAVARITGDVVTGDGALDENGADIAPDNAGADSTQ